MPRLLRRLTVVASVASAAGQYVKNHPDKVSRWAENAGRFIDKRTKGRYHKQITGAVKKVRTTVS